MYNRNDVLNPYQKEPTIPRLRITDGFQKLRTNGIKERWIPRTVANAFNIRPWMADRIVGMVPLSIDNLIVIATLRHLAQTDRTADEKI